MSRRKRRKTALENYTNDYNFIYGSYNWLNKNKDDKFNFVTLLGNVSFSDLKDDLKILNEINETNSLGFDLLVQRDIDKERVKEELIHFYLKDNNKLNFFPPIVIALVPKFENIIEKELKVSYQFEDEDLVIKTDDESIIERFPYYDDDNKEDLEDFLSSNLRDCTVKWDKNKVHAIVIDGQHRFYALKEFLHSINQIEEPRNLMPVNFVLLHPKFNSFNDPFKGTDYIRAARELFIDINKNAKSVSHQRLILLDDKSLERTLTRGAVRQFNRVEYEDSFYDWKQDENVIYLERIPQEITAWNIPEDVLTQSSEGYKLFQITSTTLLYDVISEFIFEKSKSDEIFINLNSALELERVDPNSGEEIEYAISFKNRKKKDYDNKINYINEEEESNKNTDYYNPEVFRRKRDRLRDHAFMFDRRSNNWFRKWFYEETFNGKFITMFFTGFTPYNGLLHKISGVFKNLNKYENLINIIVDPKLKTREQYLNQLPKADEKEKLEEILNYFEDENNVHPDVLRRVFQMAIFSEIKTTKNLILHLFGENDSNLAQYMGELNKLHSLGIFKKDLIVDLDTVYFEIVPEFEIRQSRFWLGIWIDQNNNIRYKDTDAIKIGDMIKMLVWLNKESKQLDEVDHHLFVSMKNKLINNATRTYLNYFRTKADFNTQEEVLEELKIDRQKFKLIVEDLYKEMINKILRRGDLQI